MREPVRDKGRLEHILQAIANIIEYTNGIDKDSFFSNKILVHATVYNVQIIGEASYKLTKEFKNKHTDTPWTMIEKMRHILVHDYYQINNEILWIVVTDDIPSLKTQISNYLQEYSEI